MLLPPANATGPEASATDADPTGPRVRLDFAVPSLVAALRPPAHPAHGAANHLERTVVTQCPLLSPKSSLNVSPNVKLSPVCAAGMSLKLAVSGSFPRGCTASNGTSRASPVVSCPPLAVQMAPVSAQSRPAGRASPRYSRIPI